MKIIITTTAEKEAETLLRQLLEERVVACGNILTSIQSFYWWKGEVQQDPEKLIIMETTDQMQEEAMQRIAELHSYDVPKIVALDAASVNEAYVQWLRGEVK